MAKPVEAVASAGGEVVKPVAAVAAPVAEAAKPVARSSRRSWRWRRRWLRRQPVATVASPVAEAAKPVAAVASTAGGEVVEPVARPSRRSWRRRRRWRGRHAGRGGRVAGDQVVTPVVAVASPVARSSRPWRGRHPRGGGGVAGVPVAEPGLSTMPPVTAAVAPVATVMSRPRGRRPSWRRPVGPVRRTTADVCSPAPRSGTGRCRRRRRGAVRTSEDEGGTRAGTSRGLGSPRATGAKAVWRTASGPARRRPPPVTDDRRGHQPDRGRAARTPRPRPRFGGAPAQHPPRRADHRGEAPLHARRRPVSRPNRAGAARSLSVVAHDARRAEGSAHGAPQPDGVRTPPRVAARGGGAAASAVLLTGVSVPPPAAA